MTKYNLVNFSVTGEEIFLTTLHATTDRGARRCAKQYLREHPVDGLVKIAFFRASDGLKGCIDLD